LKLKMRVSLLKFLRLVLVAWCIFFIPTALILPVWAVVLFGLRALWLVLLGLCVDGVLVVLGRYGFKIANQSISKYVGELPK
jgi:hypothetical protein